MDTELIARAGLHAALGDPHRLAIVDALRLSDRSPKELADLLGVGSNLVAHHLGVLERYGVVGRIPSEGDRRMRFVQLVPTALSRLDRSGRVHARRVVFVCTENSARSQFAEALWNGAHRVTASSAGTTPSRSLHPDTVRVAALHGLDLNGSSTKALPELSDQDLVVSVCDRAHDALVGRKGLRQLHWSVVDPVSSSAPDAFEQAFDTISQRVALLAPRVG